MKRRRNLLRIASEDYVLSTVPSCYTYIDSSIVFSYYLLLSTLLSLIPKVYLEEL